MNKFGILAILSAFALGRMSFADIHVAVRDPLDTEDPVLLTGMVDSSNNVTINTLDLFNTTQSTNWNVWVYDSGSTTSAPTQSIGDISIIADPQVPAGFLRLIIAPAPVNGATRSQAGLNANPNDTMPTGAVNMGGITVSPSTFLISVSAAISVAGDIGAASDNPRKKIEVGQVYHLRAGLSATPFTGGDIYADIAATSADSDVFAGSRAIHFISANKSLRGNIDAPGRVSNNPSNLLEGQGTIDFIRVTNASVSDAGITGNITANRGEINQILTTGKIGTSTAKSTISAGHGIAQIKAAADDGDPALDRDFFADVKTNLFGSIDTFNQLDRALNKLETAGDFEGTIEADFIRPADNFSVPGVGWGVFVGGEFRGRIDVRSVFSASIGVGTFASPNSANPDWGTVKIDHALHGAIVATATSGHIPCISIGRAPFGSPPLRFGFLGSSSEPQTLPIVPWNPHPADPDSPDSVIAAASIGTVTISHMLRVDKAFVPRIECPEIESLIIDDMREGVVWSGKIEYVFDTEGEVVLSGGRPVLVEPQERSNDYSQIGSIEIGCIGPGADVWFKGTPLAMVSGNMLGELYLPALETAEKIWIGERLGTGGGAEPVDLCPCNFASPPFGDDCALRTDGGWPTEGVTDFTPRRMLGEEIAEVGAIRIASPTGLSGQVIVRRSVGNDTDAQSWSGQVIVGDGSASPAPVVLSPGSESPDEAPYYKHTSPDLGGGAVGLAPFRLYENDCVPRHDYSESTTGLFEGDVNAGAPIHARFYGPIKPGEGETSWSDVLTVHCRPFGGDPCVWTEVSSAFVRSGPAPAATGALERRTITLVRASGYFIAPGVYLLQPAYAEAVLCRDLAEDKHAEWPTVCMGSAQAPGYVFIVYGDCDDDDIPDHLDNDRSTCATNCTVADFNQDGAVTVQDIFVFIEHYFVNCVGPADPSSVCIRSADVNASGAITVQDLFEFLAAYFGAHSCG